MKNIIPTCPNCRVRTFMVRDRSAEKAGGILGAIMGAGVVYSSNKTVSATAILLYGVASGAPIALGSLAVAPPAMGPVALGLIAVRGLLMTALSSSATGGLIGQYLDTKLRMRYHCNRCGCMVKG